MTTDTTDDALLVAGPRDGSLVSSAGAPLFELRIDGLVHRYLVTKQRERHGSDPS